MKNHPPIRPTVRKAMYFLQSFFHKKSFSSKKSVSVGPEIPKPSNSICREVTFIPFETKECKKIINSGHYSGEILFLRATRFFLAAALFFAGFILNIYPKSCLSISIFLFMLFLSNLVFGFIRKQQENSITDTIQNKSQFKINKTEQPAELFIKARNIPYPNTVSDNQNPSSISLYKPFSISDRPTSTIHRNSLSVSPDVSIEQLAIETIRKLGLSSSIYSQYLNNFKAFIAKTILQKLIIKIHTDDPLIDSFLSIPNFENFRPYIIQRIQVLSGSQYLAGHFGERGDRFKDREWNNQMPSDNQIVLHVLGMWLSYFMSGKKQAKRINNTFGHKYLSFSKEPKLEGDSEFILCSDDWTKFYVLAKVPGLQPERYWAFPGRESMYSGLLLLFWFLKEKKKFLLDGADLKDAPICMDRVFSMSRME